MTQRVYEVPAPRTIDVTGVNRTVQELNRQIARLQEQLDAQAAQIAALTSDTAPTVTNETTINQVTNVSGGGGGGGGGGGTSPGGADTNIQYNSSGAFAGDNNLERIVTVFGDVGVLIGGEYDPFGFGNLFNLFASSDASVALGGWLAQSAVDGGNWFVVRSRGTRAAPTSLNDGDIISQFDGIGFDSDDTVVTKATVSRVVTVDGTPTPGVVPGCYWVRVQNTAGEADTPFAIRSSWRIGLGGPFWGGGTNPPDAQVHIRNMKDVDQLTLVVDAAVAQTEDLTQWRDASENAMSAMDVLGAWHPPSLADASAQNNSIYFSTDANVLVYKDAGGTVNNLY